MPADVEPEPDQVRAAAQRLLREAAAPLATNPALRNLLIETRRRYEQTIDIVSQDVLIEAGISEEARERQRRLVASFEQYIREHKDEITALQVLYNRPYKERLRPADIRELADALAAPPRAWTSERLWLAYQTLDGSKVRGSPARLWTEIVAVLRFALQQDAVLVSFSETVDRNYQGWLIDQKRQGRRFADSQRWWLDAIRNTIVESFAVETASFDYPPFAQRGGLGGAYKAFGEGLRPLLDELNRELVA